ncbi:ABC transporter ATP-binding protein [Streptomyces sp. TRM66268-LWL]|uniref:ABC transporter ATP-binding protein n=1 Tax=Streptomyces polyasparticus TaxID=2767826 RepID=A0ABR7SV77_9ACTN|nr:ABC transporter ATP-binding protein [Streptomyces polyasparticus]MBC9718258.1 ABC transporter ATP-binding protein [Streptomyces polyasparticus]
MLQLQEISYETGGRVLVDAVTLHADTGETVGLVGPNGSGKTTLLRCVYGTLRPSSGHVLVDGTELTGAKERARRIATVPQDGQSAFELTVREVVAMGRSPHKRFWEPDTAADERLVTEALARVGVLDLAERAFPGLSGGERQRALVARALVQQPRLLVLDEPTNHLDIRYQLDILTLVRGLGTTNLLALHDLNLAAYFCDRLYVLQRGAVVAAGPPAQVLTPGLLAEVYGVRADVGVHPATGAPTVTYLPGPGAGPDVPRPTGERKSSTI